jgi:ring-1,2-phenylacetyl-CoA epoxidase subunit PaaD
MIELSQIWEFLKEVEDPEIPVLNVVELGIVRDVIFLSEKYVVSITPTYSGCPAMHAIEQDIAELLSEKGIENFEIKTVLSPAWTTDWMTSEARTKLENYGIAPPQEGSSDKSLLMGKIRDVRCPQCKSYDTFMISQFGSTACKSLYKCNSCKEPFDYFKCI